MFSRFAKMNAIVSLVVVAAAFAPAVTLADNAAPQAKVSYTNLNLKSPQDAAILYRKLVRASAMVCPDPSFESTRFLSQKAMECRAQALEGAVRNVNSPQLTALFVQQTGHEPAVVRVSQVR